ncbi:MAG: S1C family serine protease [Clostridia bacterium]
MEENNKNQNNVKNPDSVIDNSGKEFKAVSYTEKASKDKKAKTGFGKSVIVPFVSGVLGATLVVGTCFGVPSIRQNLLGTDTTNSGTISTSTGTTSGINTTQISLEQYSETGIAVAQKILPSIVGIKVEYKVSSIFMSSQTTAAAEGSGIIISEDGYILTNNHVINSTSSSSYYSIGEASKITVNLYNDETEYEAKIVGTDEQTDLAVIKIEKDGLIAAELGDSDSILVGEFAMAVGNPLGLQSSVTAGMISAVNREITDSDGKTYTLIQTDAAINSGNSGGALVNSKGQVIGINTLKVAQEGVEGMSFAIPINSAKPIYEQLIQYSKVKRPYIGITGRDVDSATAKRNNIVEGIYVVSIEEFSAAEKAGVKTGDVIVKADGKDIKTMNELNEIKNSHNIGDTMTITVNRNGNEKELTLILQEQ